MELKRAEKFSESAEIFSKIVLENPKNEEAIQQLATLLGWLGRYNESVSVWKRAIALNPKNIEYHVGLARVLSWKGDSSLAKAEYLQALEINQNDFDSLVGLGDIQMNQNNVQKARGYYLRAQSQQPENSNLKKKLAAAVPPLLWRVDAGFSYDGYRQSLTRTAERNSYAQIGRQFKPMGIQSSLWARHEWQDHFKMTDNTIYAGGSFWPVKFFAAQVEMGFTGTPNFQPTQQFSAAFDFPVGKFLIPSMRLKYMAYRDGNVNIYTPGLRLQAFSWLALSHKVSVSKNITGPDTEGWQTQADLQAGEDITMYAGYSQGNESLPPLSTAFNEAIFTGIIYQLSRQVALRVDYSYENRPNFFLRSTIGTGLTFKF